MRTVGSVAPFAESRAPYRANRNYAAFFEYAVSPQGRRFDVERGGHCRADGFCRRVAASDRLPDVGRGNVAAGTVGFVGTIFGGKGAVDCRSDRRDEQFCQRAAAFCRVGGVCPQRARRIGRNLQSGQRRMFLCRTRAGGVFKRDAPAFAFGGQKVE